LHRTLERCEDGTIGKERQPNVIRTNNHIAASKPCERIFLDVVAVFESQDKMEYAESTKKFYWRIMVDTLTQYKILDFFASKKAMIEPTCETLLKFKLEGKSIKYI
jgi:hypothetical protein